MFSEVSLPRQKNKSKNKQKGLNQIYKLLHSKGNHKQEEKTIHRMGKNTSKLCDWQGLNFQNTQTVHTAQYKKNQTTQSKHGQKT